MERKKDASDLNSDVRARKIASMNFHSRNNNKNLIFYGLYISINRTFLRNFWFWNQKSVIGVSQTKHYLSSFLTREFYRHYVLFIKSVKLLNILCIINISSELSTLFFFCLCLWQTYKIHGTYVFLYFILIELYYTYIEYPGKFIKIFLKIINAFV